MKLDKSLIICFRVWRLFYWVCYHLQCLRLHSQNRTPLSFLDNHEKREETIRKSARIRHLRFQRVCISPSISWRYCV
eukprot:UN28177